MNRCAPDPRSWYDRPEGQEITKILADQIAQDIDDDLMAVLDAEIELARKNEHSLSVAYDGGAISWGDAATFLKLNDRVTGLFISEEYTLYDGMTAMQCFMAYVSNVRGEGPAVPGSMTRLQINAAKEEWSRQLRDKVEASRQADRLKAHPGVLVDRDDD